MTRLVDMLGANRARLSIIEYLRHHPGADRNAITKALGFGHQTVYSHLTAMEASGLIRTDAEPGERHGRAVHYWLILDRLRQEIQAILDEL